MTEPEKLTASEILKKLDNLEQQLFNDLGSMSPDDFFDQLKEDLIASKLEKGELEQIRDRVKNIQALSKKVKEGLEQESRELLAQRAQFSSYIKNSKLVK